MEIKSSEFFKNIKKLPPPGTQEFKDLIDWETEKIVGGVTVNGVYFSGWLYWHLNHWWIRIDGTDAYGNDTRIISLPELRDNEWIRAEHLENCRKERKGYIEVGGRQGGKSEMEASYFGMNAIMFQNTQNVIVCGNDNDLSLLKDKVDFGLRKLWKGLAIPRLDKTWKSNQIRLGYKTPNGDDEIWSYIVIRNAKDGNNTEVAAGTTAKSFIMDEVGKYPFASAFKAAEPAFKGKNGWRAVPILVGTGGAFEDGKDAENFFYNPNSNNFLGILDEKTNKETGLFLSGIYRQDCKEKVTLTEWLKTERNLQLEDSSELDQIVINCVNKEKAVKLIESERVNAKTNPDKTLYLKQKMYYPLTVDECFLTVGSNIFDIEAAKAQQKRLSVNNVEGINVELFHDGETIKVKNSEKVPISNFPTRTSDDKNAPIVIWEMPIANAPYGLYVAGCLLPGEKVSTEKGIMSVEDVSLQNKLINVEGKEVDIYNLQRYLKKDEDIYTLKLSNCVRTGSFTKEHPILVSDSYFSYCDGKNKSLNEKKFIFDFKEIKNISKNQWVKSPNKFIEENNFDLDILWNNCGYRIDRQIKSPLYNGDFWWFIGLFLGDGWTESNGYRITIACNRKETPIIDRLDRIIRDIFNREPQHKIKNNCVEVSFNLQQLNVFLSYHFKKYANEKSIPVWVKKINVENKQQVIQGYLDSDGCITMNKERKLYGLDFVSVNLTLLEDIQDMFFSLGFVSNITILRNEGVHNICGKISKTKKTYHLRLGHDHTIKFKNSINNILCFKLQKIKDENIIEKRNRDRRGCFISEDNKYIYFQIKDIIKSKYSGWVYNFECDTHTYMCGNIPTHNCDPYRQGKSAYSDSLGAVYIYKRMHDIFGEKFQDMFVASYVARPNKKETWDEQARLLCKFYNARVLCENDEMSFIDYMVSKGDGHLLEKQPEWIREVTPNTTQNRMYGLSRASVKIRDFLHTNYKKYLEETIHVEKDEKGSITRELLGIHRIRDMMLLEETIKYTDDINVDRLVAAELAITCAMKLDPIMGKVGQESDGRIKALYSNAKKGNPRNIFSEQRTHKQYSGNINKLLG